MHTVFITLPPLCEIGRWSKDGCIGQGKWTFSHAEGILDFFIQLNLSTYSFLKGPSFYYVKIVFIWDWEYVS